MEKFETIPQVKYGIEKTSEIVGENTISVEWTASSRDVSEQPMEYTGKIIGTGSDGSTWEGEGTIYKIAVEGQTVGVSINEILTKKLVQESQS